MKYNFSKGFEAACRINGENHIMVIFDDGIMDVIVGSGFTGGRSVSWAPYTGGLFACDNDGRLTGEQYKGTCLEVWERLARSIGDRYLYKQIVAAARKEKALQGEMAVLRDEHNRLASEAIEKAQKIRYWKQAINIMGDLAKPIYDPNYAQEVYAIIDGDLWKRFPQGGKS